jgi:hypothetical protein
MTRLQHLATFAAIGALLTAAACAHQQVAVSTKCVPLKPYTPAQEAAAAAQLATLDPGSPVATMITDYKRMRDADRACIGQ